MLNRCPYKRANKNLSANLVSSGEFECEKFKEVFTKFYVVVESTNACMQQKKKRTSCKEFDEKTDNSYLMSEAWECGGTES